MSRSRSQKPTPRGTAVIDADAGATESVSSSAIWRAVTAAAADVCAEWQHMEHAATSAGDVRATVNALTENVRQALGSDSFSLIAFPPFVPVRRVLELLRRSFLERAESPEVTAAGESSALEVIKAMERVQQAIDEDAAHRFAARLSGQDAQQLVVEMAHDMRSPL